MMTSYESDDQFLDNMAEQSLTDPQYMSDEEREYYIDLEETEEELEVVEDVTVNTLADTLFGMSKGESKAHRRAVKKAQKPAPTVPKGVVSVQEMYAERLASKFNSRGVK
jgi:hypothetical protein